MVRAGDVEAQPAAVQQHRARDRSLNGRVAHRRRERLDERAVHALLVVVDAACLVLDWEEDYHH